MRLGFMSRIVSGLALGLSLGVWAPAVMASDSPVNLVADEVGYDQDLGIYVARGHVEMQQDDRVVMADVVTYNERSKTISASGNVAMLMPSGDTLFGNYVDVSDDFKDGAIQGQVAPRRCLRHADRRHQDAPDRRRLYALPAVQDRSEPQSGVADQIA
jgi:hypothetical protein